MINKRTLRDANLAKSKALPAANATNYSDAIDLGSASSGRLEGFEIAVEMPATASLADTKKITQTLQDSADGVTFADVADVPPIVSTGASGAGAAAVERRFKAPIALRQFIRLKQNVEASGGDNTAVISTLSVIF